MSRDYGASHDDSDDRKSSRSGSDSSARENFGKTGNFSTMMTDDGKFFGMNLSPELKKSIDSAYPVILPMITQKGEELATKLVGEGKAASMVGWGIALSEQIYRIGDNLYKSTKSANDLRVAVAPLQKLHPNGNLGALSSRNEVIANARGKVSGMFWKRMGDTVVSTIGALPAIILKAKSSTDKYELQQSKKAMEDALSEKDPVSRIEKIKKIEQDAMQGNSAGDKKSLSSKDVRAARDKMISEAEVDYKAKFGKYRAEELPKTVTKLKTEIGKLTPETYPLQIGVIKETGMNVDRLMSDIETARNMSGNEVLRSFGPDNITKDARAALSPEPFREKRIASLIEDFKTQSLYKANLETHADRAVTAQFVTKERAFDDTWLTKAGMKTGRGDERTTTHRTEMETEFKTRDESLRKLQTEEQVAARKAGIGGEGGIGDSKTTEGILWGLGASIGREFAGKLIGNDAKERYAKPIALDRILHLRRIMEAPKDQSNWSPPEEVPPIVVDGVAGGKGNEREKSMSYEQFVHEIFQQHQKDSKRVDIGDRFFQHFEKARWNEAAMDKIPESELTAYEFAVKTIAKRIKDGRMDAIALVELVGDANGHKIVQNDGRTFGPQGSGKTDEEVKAAILKLVDEKTAQMHTSQSKTDEQVNDKLGNFVFSVEDMKKALESEELEISQRAFIFTLFSDVVGSDEKLCQKLGIKNERCQELRKQSHETFNETLDAVVDVLVEVIREDPELLQKTLNITDKEKSVISNLAKRDRGDGKHVADLTKDREEVELLKTLAANASLVLGKEPIKSKKSDEPVTLWQRVKNKIEDLKKAKAEVAAGHDEKSHKRDHPSDDFDHASRDEATYKLSSKRQDSMDERELDMDSEGGRPSFREKLGSRKTECHTEAHHEHGEHSAGSTRKWTPEKHGEDDGFSGRIRRDKVDKESVVRNGPN